MKETDLYKPVHDYLIEQGYTVRSEVRNCDIVAVRGDEMIVIELKQTINIALLAQAVERQKITDSVYVAIPRPSNMRKWQARTRSIQTVLRRLEIGLILVSLPKVGRAGVGSFRRKEACHPEAAHRHPELDSGPIPSPSRTPHSVQVLFHPVPHDRRKQKRAQRAVLTEINGRSRDLNQGGSCRRKLVTAYRENAIHIACCLADRGPLSPKEIRALGACDKTTSILYTNVYGWFDRIGQALYSLNPKGRLELSAYDDLVEHYMDRLRDAAG